MGWSMSICPLLLDGDRHRFKHRHTAAVVVALLKLVLAQFWLISQGRAHQQCSLPPCLSHRIQGGVGFRCGRDAKVAWSCLSNTGVALPLCHIRDVKCPWSNLSFLSVSFRALSSASS